MSELHRSAKPFMNTTNGVLDAIREERMSDKKEAARWASYRRAANPPVWFIVILSVAIFAGVLAFTSYLLSDSQPSLSTVKLVVLPAFSVLYVGSWLLKRRDRAIARVLMAESPKLYEKMRTERIIS